MKIQIIITLKINSLAVFHSHWICVADTNLFLFLIGSTRQLDRFCRTVSRVFDFWLNDSLRPRGKQKLSKLLCFFVFGTKTWWPRVVTMMCLLRCSVCCGVWCDVMWCIIFLLHCPVLFCVVLRSCAALWCLVLCRYVFYFFCFCSFFPVIAACVCLCCFVVLCCVVLWCNVFCCSDTLVHVVCTRFMHIFTYCARCRVCVCVCVCVRERVCIWVSMVRMCLFFVFDIFFILFCFLFLSRFKSRFIE